MKPGIAEAWKNRADIMSQRASLAAAQVSENPELASELIATAIDSYVRAIEANVDYEGARVGLRATTGVALSSLPWTWACEDEVWRAVSIDTGCFEDLVGMVMTLMSQGIEVHPKYLELIRSEGYDLSDERGLLRLTAEALDMVRTWEWDLDFLLGPASGPMRVGTCLLADILARCGLAKLPIQLGEIVAGTRADVVTDGMRLQVAKALNTAGRSLRRGGGYDQAVVAFQMARGLYETSGLEKWAAHMTFNVGAAYARRNGRGDRDQAQTAFDAAFDQYSKNGFHDERVEAEKSAKAIFASVHDGPKK